MYGSVESRYTVHPKLTLHCRLTTLQLKYKLNLKRKKEGTVLECPGAVRRVVSGSVLGRETWGSLAWKKSLVWTMHWGRGLP